MQRYTLSYALELWQNSPESQGIDSNFQKYLSIALRQYVLPQLDPKAQNLNSSQFQTYSDEFLVNRLQDALKIFERSLASAVDSKEITINTGKNYRSAIKRFLKWMEKQGWWQSLFSDSIIKVAPFRPKIAPKSGTQTGRKLSLYGLAKDDLPAHIFSELENFKQFQLAGGRNVRRAISEHRQRRQPGEARRPKIEAIKPLTFKSHEEAILRFFGWYVENYLLSESHLELLALVNSYLLSKPHLEFLADCHKHFLSELYLKLLFNFRNQLLSELHLKLLTDVELLDDYTHWAVTTRSVCHSIGVNMAKTAIAIAKWLNYDKSTRHNWSDIPEILDLKDLRNEFAEEYKNEKQQLETDKWALKELTHEEARKIVEYLRKLAAPYTAIRSLAPDGVSKYSKKRNISAVARTWQIYLIVKILVYCPVRQEEIRNLKLGETLVREEDEDGNPYYVVKLTEHKRSTTTGKPRHYKLPGILTEDLDMWVYKWRPIIEESIKTLEGWMEFWGHKPEQIEGLRQKLASAQQGVFGKTVKRSPEIYTDDLKNRLKSTEERMAVWPTAKDNFENHNHLFFMFGKNRKNGIEVFGKPHDVSSIWRVVTRGIALASKALFGEERWTNPHALRHIAEKHIRQLGKPDITESFGMLIGHSKEMGDEYARQITSEYELTEDIVDDWWQE